MNRVLFFLASACLALQASVYLAPSAQAETGRPIITSQTYRQEISLLHLTIDRTALRRILVWDPKPLPVDEAPLPLQFQDRKREPCARKAKGLRDPKFGEGFDDSTPVILLHLWATWCEPCRDEFGLWKELRSTIFKKYKGRVRVVHIALQDEADEMTKLVAELGDKLPMGRIYFDCEERLTKNLGRAMTSSKSPPLPMTLWLDADRVVRQAMVGVITSRREEVLASTARIMRLVEDQEKEVLERSQRSNGSAP